MAHPVVYERHGRFAVIRIDHPPVNALNQSVRQGLLDALAQALVDAQVTAIGLMCAGRTFIAGADLRELSQLPQGPSLPDVTAVIEASRKPVIALMHGTALGGGLEIALACHYRLATPDTELGLPEVTLGLVPGAGGTQRLPRLVGMPLAIDMVARGRRIDAQRALACGLVHGLVHEPLLEAGQAFARTLEGRDGPPPRASDRPVPDADQARDGLDQAAIALARSARGRQAPLKCLEALRASLTLPFAEGLKTERQLFLACKDSDEHRGLVHAFFAERQAFKVPGLDDRLARPVASVAVLGAGTMGRGIAISFLDAGLPVCLFDVNPEALKQGLGAIGQHYARAVARGRLTEDEARTRQRRLSSTRDYGALATVDLVVEAAVENLGIKREIFAELDRVCRPGTVLATNTSTLDIDRIADATDRPADVIGMHFFSPANVMRLLEVVEGAATGAATQATAMSLARRLGKVGVLVGNGYGFVGNRILYRRLAEALALVTDGATPARVDRVLTAFGFPMGQFAMSDLAGLDVGYRAREERRRAGDTVPRTWLDLLVEQGRLGQKTGAGVYRYEPGDRTPREDVEVLRLIERFRAEEGVTVRAVSDEEIRQRCLYVMVNEAFRILDEGIARRPVDIDVIWNCGYGFPAHKGGLMYWAEREGLATIQARLLDFHDQTGEAHWRPADGLNRRLAEAGAGGERP